jgi:aconitate hydratase
MFGDTLSTDHISPIGAIPADSPAGKYLQSIGISPRDFNSYAARRLNHDVMVRGTFAHPRLRNEMRPGEEGGWTTFQPSGKRMSIFEAARRYHETGTPLVVVAGARYGAGSSRDWAAKGPRLLGVRAIIAESFERIHRSNLAGIGILPLEFPEGQNRGTLKLDGSELFDISGLQDLSPRGVLLARITRTDGSVVELPLTLRLDTVSEVEYYLNGGILHYALRTRLAAA